MGVVDFMKYNNEDEYWYHKPGRTAPLRYKYHPSAKVWTNEHSYGGSELLGDTIYDSDIYYIVYSVPPNIIGSFDIIFDGNKWPRNSGVTRQSLSYTGPIGVFTLYENGHWVL